MAVEELRVVVGMSADIQPRSTLAKWEKELHLRDTSNPVCRWCDAENQPATKFCTRCGAELPLNTPISRWLVGGRTAKTRYLLLVVSIVTVATLSLMISPANVLIPIGLGIVAIIGWSLLRSVTKP
jgi:ribosomal protein L40E